MDDLLLDYNSGLDLVDKDEELYKVLLEGFLEDNSFDINFLLKLYSNAKLEECASYIHRIKGSARQIGAKDLSGCGQIVEDLFRQKNAPLKSFPDQEVKKFYSSYEKTKTAVEDYLKSKSGK